MTINIISDRCNMTYENYINQPKGMCETEIKMNLVGNPELIKSLDRNKIQPLIRKYFHITFKIKKCI